MFQLMFQLMLQLIFQLMIQLMFRLMFQLMLQLMFQFSTADLLQIHTTHQKIDLLMNWVLMFPTRETTAMAFPMAMVIPIDDTS